MKTQIFIGKGGVGKTTCAVSVALSHASQGRRTAIIDYDGGHSVRGTLGSAQFSVSNQLVEVAHNLHAFVVDTKDFLSITKAKQESWPIERYLAQFPEDEGIIPFADMVTSFFGAPTDIPTLQKFTLLVGTILRLEDEGFENVVIDVEPTAGFERLLSNSEAMARSLRNLQDQGKITLLALAAKWPDIATYLQGNYIKNAKHFVDRVLHVVTLLRASQYYLVCVPESIPAQQTFEVRKVVEKFDAQVTACIVNNVRGEQHELAAIQLLKGHNLPLLKLERKPALHDGNHAGNHEILITIGNAINELPA